MDFIEEMELMFVSLSQNVGGKGQIIIIRLEALEIVKKILVNNGVTRLSI